jgi:hypothetical protein
MTTTRKKNTTKGRASTTQKSTNHLNKNTKEGAVKASVLYGFFASTYMYKYHTLEWWEDNIKRKQPTDISNNEMVDFEFDTDEDLAIPSANAQHLIQMHSCHFRGIIAAILMLETCYDPKNRDINMLSKVLTKYSDLMLCKCWIRATGLHQFLEIELELMEWAKLHKLEHKRIHEDSYFIHSEPADETNIGTVMLPISEAFKIAESSDTPRGRKVRLFLEHTSVYSEEVPSPNLFSILLEPPLNIG